VARHLYYKEPRIAPNGKTDTQRGSYLGPGFTDHEIEAFLDRNKYVYTKYSEAEKNELLARELDKGKILGFFAGRMEFGPRSLGGRSIIGDARNSTMQSKMNLKIKFRESFRPFAPAVLREDVNKYFRPGYRVARTCS
jgi:carbamoyltransferase